MPRSGQAIDPIIRVMRRIRIDEVSECWFWLGAKNSDGYGHIGIGSRTDGTRCVRATHQITYEYFVGIVPSGLEIDHLCSNRECCNPAHLQAVAHTENTRRGDIGKMRAEATHCIHGHQFTLDNTRITNLGQRSCKTCNRLRLRRHGNISSRTILCPICGDKFATAQALGSHARLHR